MARRRNVPRRDDPTRSTPARPSSANQARGRWGEDTAARWYLRNGFEVLDRNWRGTHGELDLVVGAIELVVFVEVKARRTQRFGPAAAAVDATKQRRIRATAIEWLAARREGGDPVQSRLRFDVVAITGTQLQVFEAAF